MFWYRGLGRAIRIGAWLVFGVCFVLGTALIALFGSPCPAAEPGQMPMTCGTIAMANFANANTLLGLAALGLALLANAARNAERRRLARTGSVDEPPIRIRLSEAQSTPPPFP